MKWPLTPLKSLLTASSKTRSFEGMVAGNRGPEKGGVLASSSYVDKFVASAS